MHPRIARYFRFVRAVAMLCVVSLPFWVWALFFSGDYEYASAIALVPVVFFLNWMVALEVGKRDHFLARVLPTALLLKLAATSMYLFVTYRVYDKAGDILIYFNFGRQLAADISTGSGWTVLDPFWGTNFLIMVSGYLMVFIGPSLPTATVIFSMLSFWGQYFFYRAFCTAFPEGDRYTMGMLVFFLPSLVFWTSAIGKEAVIVFFIGLFAYGFSKIYSRGSTTGYALLAVGIVGVLLVRPHIAAMFVLAALVPYLGSSNRGGLMGVLAKAASVPIFVAGAYYLVSEAQNLLNVDTVAKGMTLLRTTAHNSQVGGSAFGAGSSAGSRILMSPFLLFRPFPWEVHNVMSAIASLEGVLLLYFFWRARKQLWLMLRVWRRNFFVGFVFLYGLQFSVIFAAAVSNFGILNRERMMFLPLALMLPLAGRLGVPVMASRPAVTVSPPQMIAPLLAGSTPPARGR